MSHKVGCILAYILLEYHSFFLVQHPEYDDLNLRPREKKYMPIIVSRKTMSYKSYG